MMSTEMKSRWEFVMNGINKKFLQNILLFMSLCLLAHPVIAREKQAGKTLLTRGSVIAKRSSGNIGLKRRSPIFEKDEIHVGRSARAQFRMIDQAIISLQENSVLQIKKYKFTRGATSNSALLELLKGGLRTITGAIGKGNKKAYELRTPLATIGIRGTDYEVEIVSNGMYVATWEGIIHLRSRLKNGCNMLLGRSQPYMFVFIDRQGKCKGLQQVPNVFRAGHSSNINLKRNSGVAKASRKTVIEPLLQSLPLPAGKVFNHNGLNIDRTRPSTEIISKADSIDSNNPVFKVGLEQYQLASTGQLSNFQQAVGGYKLSWGFWNKFSIINITRDIDSTSPSEGMIWAAYDKSDPSVVAARTGTVRYDNVSESLLSASSGQVSNLQVQMDVNFESGNVTNGALSANTPKDTWIAVFDGKIEAGDMDLQLNGVNVIDSNPDNSGAVRGASGFINGDFIGNKAEAVLGSFGFSENNRETNHIEGVFIVE